MPQLKFNTYGKTGVRLTQVLREGARHHVVELSAKILLEGDLAESYTAPDNSRVLPTDTMKNTVYIVARRKPISSIEEFAIDLAQHHLSRLTHVHTVSVEIEETPWDRIDGHGSAFVQSGGERRFVSLTAGRDENISRSGILNLELLKTARSGFSGFLKDEYTTLPETSDRLFGTVLDADWSYHAGSDHTGTNDLNQTHAHIRHLLLEAFAVHDSLSVQHTLYAMGEHVLKGEPLVNDIHLVMPNKHRLLFDLSRFGLDNPNQIFVLTDEPSGYIEATISRN